MKLYFVATFEDINSSEDKRVVGFFIDLETARQCVEENWCDLNEDGFYKHVVIEDVEPGLYQSMHSCPIFYEWQGDADTGGYKEIDRPKELINIYGFTIG